jgi:general secretion pathway protein K
LASARSVETVTAQGNPDLQDNDNTQDAWRLDNKSRILKFPAGEVEVWVADEAGKINLNQAKENILLKLFMVLNFSEIKSRTMVDSIIDWRTRGEQPRPYGAKSSYYLLFEPPYVSKNSRFETVEELAWVRGFENSSIIPKLTDFLTVQATGPAININTAPPQVLRAAGFSDDSVATIIMARQQGSLKNLQEIGALLPDPLLAQRQQFSFVSSLFFTIKSKGMVNNGKGPYTTKVIVRLQPNHASPWSFVSWMDDFPG